MKFINELKNKYNDKRTLKINETSNIAIKPKLFKQGFNIKYNKQFIEDDVKIMIEVNGELNVFSSKPNSKKFSANFCATKKF